MVYATAAQALSYMGRLGKTTSTTTYPSLDDLTTFLADRAAQIDQAFQSRGLAVPLTSATVSAVVLADVARLNAKGAAADMMNAAYITNDSNDRGTGQILGKEFQDRINQIYQGVGVPTAMPVAERDLAPRTWSTEHPDEEQRPMFARGRTW